MARWIRRIMLLTLVIGGLAALLLWWWLRRRPEEVILRTELGTISRARRISRPPAEPVQVSPADAALNQVEEPALSSAEGLPADDLTRIAGIGPKISSVLQDAGVITYSQLAETDVDRLRQILNESGIRLADPDTWPEQARLAAAGDWDALNGLQGQLKGGRRV
jgi:predicted flap endonuclease-1-like 5' DNA nuclease